ncbi:MAG TPA: flagellar hook-basal body complex protein FliE [Rhodobacterales bacterium]|nr:flagellar hook-basal body complex protein FliE [Rhodobacterales bacterium]
MDIRSSLAAQQYAATRPATAPKAQPDGPGGAFGKAAGDFADTLRQGEETAMAAMTGDADPNALVQALAQTELAVETAVTVRDKVVEAYQEILRMPV